MPLQRELPIYEYSYKGDPARHVGPMAQMSRSSTSDKWALPLCSRHHREQHSMSESEFWASHGINPFALAISYRRPE